MDKNSDRKFHLFLLVIFFVVMIWSAISPRDIFTWFMEVLPAIIGLVIILYTYNKFRLSNLVYILLVIHASILFIGGHYTYAEMPLFSWIRDAFELERNYYDRLGHFAQGFVPALIAREILIRKKIVNNKRWISFFVIAICLSLSVSYEFFEWGVAEVTGTAADAFLGTQGDIWDTQWDMFMALIGALTAILFMTKIHDKSMKRL